MLNQVLRALFTSTSNQSAVRLLIYNKIVKKTYFFVFENKRFPLFVKS